MSSHPTTATDTCLRHPMQGDSDALEGYRRLAHIMAEFLSDVSVEPISTGDAGDAGDEATDE